MTIARGSVRTDCQDDRATREDLSKVAPRTVQQVQGVVRAMLNQAMRDELIGRNVARLVQPPTPDREEIRPWTAVEARTFTAAARGHRMHALLVVAPGPRSAARRTAQLRWSDADFAAGQLRVW